MGARSAIGLAAALLLSGGAFASPSLYVPGAALAILAGGAVVWVLLAAHGARVEREPGPRTVVEGEPYPLRIRIRGGLLFPRGELTDPLLPRPVRVSLAGRDGVRVAALRSRASLRTDVRFSRWGRHTAAPPRLLVSDPLGLFSRSVEGQAGDEVLVLPQIEPVMVAGARDGEGGAALSGAGEGVGPGLQAALGADLDGLRPYREGSPASRIHWPAVARHRELIERRLTSGGEGTALVVLDAERPADAEALARAVRAAASLGFHLARAGGCTLLISGSGRPLRIDPQLRHWSHAHARLALVEAGGALRGVAQAQSGGPVFWVTAAADGAQRRIRGARTSFLITPMPPAGARPAFTVAGCHGLPVAGRRGAREPIARAA